MVLESLFNPFVLKKKPWEMFIAGFTYSIISLVLSFLVFREASGLLAVFLVVLATIPLLYVTIKNEEELDEKYDKEWWLLKEHTRVLVFLMFLILGVTLAFVAFYVFSPQDVTNTVFKLQQEAVINVNQNIQAALTGGMTRIDLFERILVNNLKVLFFCLVFSFLYGSGAMFILTWNASVVAVAIGSLFKMEIIKGASIVGLSTIPVYFGVATFSFFRYMTHGLFEMAAYFVAGLAGGIISIALIKHSLRKHRVLADSLYLVLISIGLLILAGFVEVFITPIFFM